MVEQTSIIDIRGFQVDTPSLIMAIGVVGILMIMIMPLPTLILDLLLSLGITIGILILLMSLYNADPLEFSSFPSLLLITTLYRLSLNIASTRLILLRGHEGEGSAGQVIQSFGNFMVGGNFAVGLIIFLIMVLINFIVITKGSGRIAEVSARFILDAMPGKQMAIDADLNAGLIDEDTARTRRDEISKQSEFYGAMDGASKFVRGEAIASLVIMGINILGGLTIGVLLREMSLIEAAQTFTLLTIGDGLVSQIPALIISTSAGILVSRAASDGSMGKELAKQFSKQPQAMVVASVIIFFFGIIPGLPHIPFLVLGLLLGSLAYISFQQKQAAKATEEAEATAATEAEKGPPEGSPETVESYLPLDILELEVGYGLISLVDENQEGDLLERIRGIRRQFATDMGLIVPPLHVRDNLQLKPDEYILLLKGVQIARNSVMSGYLLAMAAGEPKRKIEGIETTEPAFQLPAFWIKPEKKEEAQLAGYTVVDISTVIATHLTEILREQADDLLGRQDTQKLLDRLAQNHPKVIEELIPNLLQLGTIQKVLQNLLREKVSIRDMLSICETLADFAPMTKDHEILTEYVRQKLSRLILSSYTDESETISILTLANQIEDTIRESVKGSDQGSFLSLSPDLAQKIIEAIQEKTEAVSNKGYVPIIICNPVIRRHLRHLIERFLPHVVVLSHNELTNDIKIESLGTIDLG